MAENFDPNAWRIAGYEGPNGDWYDVEDGAPLPDYDDLQNGDLLTVAYTDADDVTHYWTLRGGYEDYEAVEAAIADLADHYGVA